MDNTRNIIDLWQEKENLDITEGQKKRLANMLRTNLEDGIDELIKTLKVDFSDTKKIVNDLIKEQKKEEK